MTDSNPIDQVLANRARVEATIRRLDALAAELADHPFAGKSYARAADKERRHLEQIDEWLAGF